MEADGEETHLLHKPLAPNSPYEHFNIPAPTGDNSSSSRLSGLQAILSYFHLYDSLPPNPSQQHQHQQHHELMDSSQDDDDISPQNFVSVLTQSSSPSSNQVNGIGGTQSAKRGLTAWNGVFLPTWLSIWGILVFVRLGYCIGQSGILPVLGMFILGFFIAITTALSISAIGTNGTVRGGGPYFMISRTLGVEFGGCIGILFCVGNVLGNAMNAFGFLEQLLADFNNVDGQIAHLLPTGPVFNFIYGTLLLLVCAGICSLGASAFAKTSVAFFFIMSFCTAFFILSFLITRPFVIPDKVEYTSWNSETFHGNLYANYTISAVTHEYESFNSIFGILYPSCTGILAGASMSGDLRNPGDSIPKGTLSAIGVSVTLYILITFFIGATIHRTSLVNNFTVLSTVSVSPLIIKLAIYCAAIYAIVGGILTTAKIMQAMSRDAIIPYMKAFGYGKGTADEPLLAVLFVWLLSELLLFVGELNLVVPFVTMFTLLSYGIINFACFLLKVASAPNFRPSFVYFHWSSAFFGFLSCLICMFVVSGVYAASSLVLLVILWAFIHFVSPPKAWGEIQQALIYHQVRKYLLRLDVRKEHVKFWRPQILLLNGPIVAPVQLIGFANSMKKGSLYILAEVILTFAENDDDDHKEQSQTEKIEVDFSVYRKKRLDLMEFVDQMGIKAFSEVIISQSFREGVRSLLMTCGLGGMKPNILLLPWHPGDEAQSQKGSLLVLKEREYVNIIRDAIDMGKSVAIGRGFEKLSSPAALSSEYGLFSLAGWKSFIHDQFLSSSSTAAAAESPINSNLPFIDLYPMLMNDNYNTFMMVLQLGCILHMVPRWARNRRLRVIGIVEDDSMIEGENEKLKILLRDLRIKASLLIVSLECVGVSKSGDFVDPTAHNQDQPSSSSTSATGGGPGSGVYHISSANLSSANNSRPQSPIVLRRGQPNPAKTRSIRFNQLSLKHQCEILNRVFRVYSHPDQTGVILTSLYSPRNAQSCEEFMETIRIMSRGSGEEEGISMGLPPMLMTYGQGLVVTKNL